MATVPAQLLEMTQDHLDNHGTVFTTSWTSSSGGTYTETVDFRGFIAKIDFIPGTGGNQPSDNYGVQLLDSNGRDVLAVPNGFVGYRTTTKTAVGASLGNAAPESYPEPMKGTNIITYVNGNYTISISAAGNTKSGTIVWTIKNR